MNKTKVYIEVSVETPPENKDNVFVIDYCDDKRVGWFDNDGKFRSEIEDSTPVTYWLQPVERYVLEEEEMIDLFDKYKSTLLKEISETFLKSSNQVMADRETDRHVFQAIGETIENFPFDSTLFLNSK